MASNPGGDTVMGMAMGTVMVMGTGVMSKAVRRVRLSISSQPLLFLGIKLRRVWTHARNMVDYIWTNISITYC